MQLKLYPIRTGMLENLLNTHYSRFWASFWFEFIKQVCLVKNLQILEKSFSYFLNVERIHPHSFEQTEMLIFL